MNRKEEVTWVSSGQCVITFKEEKAHINLRLIYFEKTTKMKEKKK